MNSFRHWNVVRQLALYLLLVTVMALVLQGIFRWQSELQLDEQRENLARNYAAVILIHERIAQFVYRQQISHAAVLQVMRQASTADPNTRNKLREQLYQQLLPVYHDLAAEGVLRQFQLHLPDGSSFLRMHRPKEFGDQLLNVRPALRMVQQSRQPLKVFETGRHGSGFRFLFPLMDGKNLVGSVEMGMGFQSIRLELEKSFAGEYVLLVKRHDIEQKTFQHERGLFTKSSLNAAYFQEQFASETHDNHLAPQLLEEIAAKAAPHISASMASEANVATVVRIGFQHYMVLLMPLKDAEGNVNAYLCNINRSNSIDNYHKNMLLTLFAGFIMVALLQGAGLRMIRFSKELRVTNNLFQATIDALPYPFYVVDTASYRIRICNKLACEGVLLSGMTCHLLTHKSATPCENSEHPCPMKQVIETGKQVIVEHLHYDRNGEPRHVEVHGYPIFGENGAINDFIEYSVDITERKESEAKLLTMAEKDHLTGCHNRRKLYQLLEIEIRRARRHERPFSLLMLDLDHFKQVNDRFGHDQGDKVLAHVTSVMQETLRQTDMLGRYGGEEFMVLLPESDQDQAIAIAERLRRNLRRAPAERVGVITISIGVATLGSEEGSDSLVKRADEALYRAKQNGRNRYEISLPTPDSENCG